jgi:ABC-2 type transport system permease protein
MTATLPAVPTSPNDLGSRGRSRRRVLALASAEIRLLLRNRTAAVNSLLGSVLFLGSVGVITVSNGGEVDGPSLIASAIGIGLILVTYYNLARWRPAQFTTLPLVLAAMMLSGLLFPLSGFPEQLA